MADTDDILIPATNPVIWINPGRVGGTPCFYRTRVPVKTLFEYLEAGDSLEEFLSQYPGITREHAAAVLQRASRMIEIDATAEVSDAA